MTIFLNKVCIIGYLGSDPEIKQFNNGNEYAILSVATSDSYKDKEGKRISHTEWHRIAIFKKPIISFIKEYVKIGDQVFVEGSIKKYTYQNDNGIEQTGFQIEVKKYNHSIQIGSKKENQSEEILEIEEGDE